MFSFLGLLNNDFTQGAPGMNALSPANFYGRDFGQAFNAPTQEKKKYPGLGPLEFLDGSQPWQTNQPNQNQAPTQTNLPPVFNNNQPSGHPNYPTFSPNLPGGTPSPVGNTNPFGDRFRDALNQPRFGFEPWWPMG